MDWFFDIVDKFGPVVYFFTTAGLGVFAVFIWRQLRDHEDGCEKRNASNEKRFDTIEKAVVENRTDVKHLVEDITEMKGDIKTILRNGSS